MTAPTPGGDAGELAIVGRIRKAHGIRGELVVEAFTSEPAAIFAAGRRLFGGTPAGRPLPARAGHGAAPAGSGPADWRVLEVRRASPFKGGWIVGFAGIDDRNEADQWRERTLLLPSAELPALAEDEVHYHDLVGMRVVQAGGAELGEVAEVVELPQGLALDVRVPGRRDTVLVLYRPELVVEVDTAARVVTVDPPEGLFD